MLPFFYLYSSNIPLRRLCRTIGYYVGFTLVPRFIFVKLIFE